MTTTREQVKEAIDKVGTTMPPRTRQLAEDAIVKIMEGVPPAIALGFTPDMMEVVYKYGYTLFQAGKFKEALDLFTFLRKLDVSSYRYSFAIAACHQYRHEYEEAGANYIICSYLDRLNPIPSFHLYDCFVKLDKPMSALQAIKETIALAELNPQYNELKEKALLEYKGFKKGLKKYIKEHFDKEHLDQEFIEKEGQEL